MKYIFTFILTAVFTLHSFSQIKEKQVRISLGIQPCLTAEIQGIKKKKVEKLWKKFFKKYGKVKKNGKAKEYYSTAVRINSIKSGDPVDIYAKFEDFNDNVVVNLCIDMGTAFLSQKEFPEDYYNAEELLDEFLIYVKRYMVSEELKEEEENFDKLNKKLKKLKSNNAKLHDKIKKYKEKIAQAERDIEENLLEQEKVSKEIEEQAKRVKEIREKLDNIGR